MHPGFKRVDRRKYNTVEAKEYISMYIFLFKKKWLCCLWWDDDDIFYETVQTTVEPLRESTDQSVIKLNQHRCDDVGDDENFIE